MMLLAVQKKQNKKRKVEENETEVKPTGAAAKAASQIQTWKTNMDAMNKRRGSNVHPQKVQKKKGWRRRLVFFALIYFKTLVPASARESWHGYNSPPRDECVILPHTADDPVVRRRKDQQHKITGYFTAMYIRTNMYIHTSVFFPPTPFIFLPSGKICNLKPTYICLILAPARRHNSPPPMVAVFSPAGCARTPCSRNSFFTATNECDQAL